MWLHNRWFRLGVFSLATLTTSCIYFGWQQYSLMLFKAQAYSWLCPDTHDFNLGPCDDQDKAVQTLFTIASAAEFSLGFLGGILYDSIGPRRCAAVGEAMFFCGMILLPIGSPSFPLYIPAMFLLGGAVNVVAMPSLILSQLFPRNANLAIASVVACQTGCTIIAPILYSVWSYFPTLKFQMLIFYYLGCVWFPVSVLYVAALPQKSNCPGCPVRQIEGFSDQKANMMGRNVRPVFTSWVAFAMEFFSTHIIWFTVYYCAQILQFVYFPVVLRDTSGESVSRAVGWMMPSQMIWGIIFGFFSDKLGTLNVCVVLVLLTAVFYFLALFQSVVARYTAGFVYVVACSYIYTTKYTFVKDLRHEEHFGKHVGLIGFLAGAVTLTNIPITNYGNTDNWFRIFLVVCLPLLLVLWRVKTLCKTLHNALPRHEALPAHEAPPRQEESPHSV